MRQLFTSLFCTCCSACFPQTTLKCTAPPDTNGIPGVVVSVEKDGTRSSFVTDNKGETIITTSAPYLLHTKCIGYDAYTDTIQSDFTHLSIRLTENSVQLNDVVVTAQYQPTNIDNSTYRIKMIDQKKISDLAAVNLKDALSNELNIRFSQDNALGMSSMSLQGISGQNVKVLIDGVPVIGRQDGSLDLSQINMNNVERIEIVEGPMAVNYGTDALAGVINIITRKAVKTKREVTAQTYYESSHTYNAGLSFSLSKKNQGIRISGGRNYFNGWNPNESFYLIPVKTPADTNRYKSWKPREQYFTTLDYSFTKDKLTLAYKGSYFNELIVSRGKPVAPYYETAFDDYFKTTRFDHSVNTGLKLKNYKAFSNILAFNYYERRKNTWFKNLTDLDQHLSSDASLQDTSRFTLLMMRGSLISRKPFMQRRDSARHNRFNYELGYDLNHESAMGKRISGRMQYISDLAAYGSAEWQPKKDLIIRPGLRYAYNSLYRAPLIPSLHLKYQLKQWVLRASYSKGFRAPTLKELYFDFTDINHNITGNRNLKAETSHNLNASWKYTTKQGNEGGKKNISMEQSFFYNNINDLITLGIISGTQYSYINIGAYITYGSSVNTSFTCRQLTVSAGGAYIARYNQLSETYAGTPKFSYAPEGRASLQYNFVKISSSFNLFYKYSGRLPGIALNSDNQPYQTFINAYQMLDANFSTRFFKKKFTVSMGAKNLFDVTNVLANAGSSGSHSTGGVTSAVAMGRVYFLKLDYVFSN